MTAADDELDHDAGSRFLLRCPVCTSDLVTLALDVGLSPAGGWEGQPDRALLALRCAFCADLLTLSITSMDGRTGVAVIAVPMRVVDPPDGAS